MPYFAATDSEHFKRKCAPKWNGWKQKIPGSEPEFSAQPTNKKSICGNEHTHQDRQLAVFSIWNHGIMRAMSTNYPRILTTRKTENESFRRSQIRGALE
jgi:hypothetical protein